MQNDLGAGPRHDGSRGAEHGAMDPRDAPLRVADAPPVGGLLHDLHWKSADVVDVKRRVVLAGASAAIHLIAAQGHPSGNAVPGDGAGARPSLAGLLSTDLAAGGKERRRA